MPEYREFRCCLCPNLYNEPEKDKCPAFMNKTEITPCRFVKTYIDERGWKYRVMSGIGEDAFKGRYNKPYKTGWKGMPQLEWCKTFDKAQSNLNAYAKSKGWSEYDGDSQ